ncbi:MAG: 3-isopropylmalate dehydratase large subunit [Deltaproteobacteria bacterium]|nr:3-isopropylmalate dehydratase large subunit [Deltaproteobacteria bacterium]
MGMTMAEKILARHSGMNQIKAGEYVTAKVDQVCIYDSFIDIEKGMLESGIEGGLTRVWDKSRVVILIDHGAPAMDKNVKMAQKHVAIRNLVKKLDLPLFFDVKAGICHQVMVDKGFILPGSFVVVPDSHTTIYGALNCGGTGIGETEMAWVLHFGELWFQVPETIKVEVSGDLKEGVTAKDIFLHISGTYGTEVAQYKSMEWVGPTIDSLSLDGRLCIANQSVELGAKFSLFKADQKTLDFVKDRAVRSYEPVQPDPDAKYEKVYEVDAAALEPLVAQPHSLEVVNPAAFYGDVKINQANIGGCANGRLEDIAWAARILKGKTVHRDVRCIVGPASWVVYKEAMQKGYLETLIDAGVIVCHPHCGPCTGMMGAMAPGEVCITATSRNFKGRMGSPEASIYLASPATVAASAIAGHIIDPREVL